MATVYDRIKAYRKSIGKGIPHPQDRAAIGAELAKFYNGEFSYCNSPEKGGTMRVRNYPDEFTPEIDRFIVAYYTMKKLLEAQEARNNAQQKK